MSTTRKNRKERKMTTEVFVSESNGNLFNLDVSRGFVNGHEPLYKFGSNPDINGAEETIWEQGGNYVWPTSAAQRYVSSSSADDALGGTGATTIRIFGLDANYNRVQEDITLTGQTQKITVNSYLRVFRAFVTLSGSGGTAAGTVYVADSGASAGVPTGNVYANFGAGNQTQLALYTVPAGYTLYLDDVNFSTAMSLANNTMTVKMNVRTFGSNTFRTIIVHQLQSNVIIDKFEYPLKIEEKSDIELRAVSTSINNPVSASFQGVLIKNDIEI
jgi:hypothetical protein